MALTTESAGRVRAKTNLYVKSPAILMALKALFLYLATTKKNPDLSFEAFTSTSIDDAGGEVLVDAACTLYAVYSKKRNTATDAYLVILDDATDDAGGATDARVVLPHLVGNDEAFAIFPQGIAMATGVVAKSYTDFDGTTDTSAGDAPDGFCIVAAA
jgi:hypothetical protein